MENQLTLPHQHLEMAIKHLPVGLAEIDHEGFISHLNLKGESLLKPILIANNIYGKNLFPVLEKIAPAVLDRIKISNGKTGNIVYNDLHSFFICFGGEKVERHFNFIVTKISDQCIIVGFEDITERYGKDKAMVQLASDRAVIQGKFEIASNVLHDIGNAIVGFGSYITRLRRSLDNKNSENLQKLTGFFATQEKALAGLLGQAKASAAINMLQNLSESQKTTEEEMRKSVAEQLNIINHVQEILNIQRQYLSGHAEPEKKPTNLRSVITDCMSMVFASLEKRSIKLTLNVPETLPVISGDRTKLMQVILNILKNSIEAIDITAKEKHIWLNVKAKDDKLMLEVKDNGVGFDHETGDKLFTRGFTTKASGTGLGLDNCRSILESHGGTINIRSEGFGKGAITTIQFKI